MEKQQKQQQHHHQSPEKQNQTWGTWEELLLACAVNRHGFKDWDAVAMEVQSHTALPHLLTTARDCEQKFHDLNRRFTDQCNDDVPEQRENGASAGDKVDHVPWLDELRKLRVDELRQEVQRYDVSILSLQLKVKRLEEEREKISEENDRKRDEKPDLVVSGNQRPENDENGGKREEPEPANSEPETRRLDNNSNNNKLPTGDESDRDNQSVNESNSTGSRFEGVKTGEGNLKLEPEPVHTGSKEPDPVGRIAKPVGEESNNGSYDTVAKVPTCESLPPSEERKVEDSSELRDSVAHSRDGEGGTREGSEVQSSASLTRKRKTRWRKEVSSDDCGGEDAPENDEVAMKSEPLVSVLELIKGHEHSSSFERRLESQESDRYKNIVRQHVDLEAIHSRLQKGSYASCSHAFFRDLLLLFTNAIVFFAKDSTEARAAQQLRRLVIAEIKNRVQTQSDPTPQKTDSSLIPNPSSSQAKPDSLFSKHKASAPILVCRKRSAISAKPSSATTFGQKCDQPIDDNKKEKPASEAKPLVKPSSSDTDKEEPPKAKEKPVTGARSLRRSNKNLSVSGNNPSNKKVPSNSTTKAGSASKLAETPKPDKSKAEGTDKKRTAAADFLKRIKRNAPVEVVKSSGGSSSTSRGGGGGGGKDQKKMASGGKGDKGKERPSRHNVGGSAEKKNKNENSSQSKRSVGRPPKKVAAETNAVSAKRGRESSGGAGKDKRPKKRSKK